MNLYMYYLGGTAPGANIELHDVQFAVVEAPEEGFSEIAERWFGEKSRLHVDIITRINWADGYDVSIGGEPDTSGQRLYFVNMGGYIAGEVIERHTYDLIVAKDEAEAKAKAKDTFVRDYDIPHRDALIDVDGFLALSEIGGRHIRLKENPDGISEAPLFQGYEGIGINRTTYDPVTNSIIMRPEIISSDGQGR